MSRDISNSADILDSRDIIARIDELTSERDDLKSEAEDDTNVVQDEAKAALAAWEEDNAEELRALLALQDDASGSPDWRHGETLIRDSYFEDYARELAEDCGMLAKDTTWPNNCIDWEWAAHELQYDYTSVDYDGVTYWIRS